MYYHLYSKNICSHYAAVTNNKMETGKIDWVTSLDMCEWVLILPTKKKKSVSGCVCVPNYSANGKESRERNITEALVIPSVIKCGDCIPTLCTCFLYIQSVLCSLLPASFDYRFYFIIFSALAYAMYSWLARVGVGGCFRVCLQVCNTYH